MTMSTRLLHRLRSSWLTGLSLALAGLVCTAAILADLQPAVAQSAPAAARHAASPGYKLPQDRPRIYLSDAANRARLQKVMDSASPAAARFRGQVESRLLGRQVYAFQPWYAALVFQLGGDKRFADFAVDETDKFVAAEEERIRQGQRPQVAGDSYLEVGPIIGNLAIVYDWCHDKLTPQMRARWVAYANQAVWNVWNHTQARWGSASHPWTGWSVNNPSNNYYYSFLRATMLLGLATHGENPQAQGWIEHFRNAKMEGELFPTFNRDLAGGGSREGTGYGTAMKGLWQLYDWWARSTGESLAARTPHSLASMAHLIHSVVPTLDRLAPTGDHARDATAQLFDYHREYLLVLMGLFPQERLSGVARSLLEASTVPQMKSSFMFFADYLYEQPDIAPRPLTDLATTYWGPGTGQLMMRSAWQRDATFANFICGPLTESHAHRDQGSFVIHKGTWLALDSNMYSRSGIEQDEEMHNLVRMELNGVTVKQAFGTSCQMAAMGDSAQFTYASARITPSFKGRPGVARLDREFVFIKPSTFVVLDRALADRPGTRRIWTMNLPERPTVNGDALSMVTGNQRLDVQRLAPSGLATEIIPWVDQRRNLSGGFRIDVPHAEGLSTTFLHVLSVNGAVASAQRADTGSQIGVVLKLADGRSATLRFSPQGGGMMEMRAADGAMVSSGPLPSSVTAPPLFVN